jgi:UMF1 family MFS transporter
MWLLSVVGMFFYLKVRPGPDLKACREMHADGGRNYQGCYAGLGWYSTFCIFREAKVYPQTIRFLILWFFYSDTYSTIASFGIVFARYQLCMPEALLAGVLLLVTFVAMLGSFVADKLMERYKIKAKTVLVFCLCTYCCISAWGMIGIFSKTLGMRSQIEVWFFCIAHGMVIGSIQSVSRTIFSDLIPHGREGEFFGLFEISDKGSSWLGPAVIAAISTAMPDKIHYGFLYLCFMCIWPTVCVWKYVDVEQGARDVAKFDIKNEAMGVHNSDRGAFACIDAQPSKPATTVDDTANSPQKLERV